MRGSRQQRRISVLAAPVALSAACLLAVPVMAASEGSGTASVRHGSMLSRPTPGRVAVTWRQRGNRFVRPVQVTSANDGTDRLFVVERRGTIRVWRNGRTRPGNYLDLQSRVWTSSVAEQGMLSVVFAPDFRRNHRLWVTYTRRDGALVLAALQARRADARRVRPRTARTVLVVPHPGYPTHNAGQLMFGRDGMLYISTGDGGNPGDPFAAAQNTRDLRGKILRIDVNRRCGTRRYCSPADNPFAGRKLGRDEIWLLGLRNPWRWSFDSATGAMWIGDVGQDAVEEINRVAANPTRRNLGWSCWEGKVHYLVSRCNPSVDYVFPVVSVAHPTAEAIIGGFVYRGRRFAASMRGTYVFADDITGRVWVFRKGYRLRLQRAPIPGKPTSFGVDDHKELWAVSLDGRLWSMRARSK